ncbi:MAG TPA: nitronate monooxygenase [Dehalococcoidia bacterium]|nr:nitronate monooxygenase [Dehalococcoidia bacterium]
MLRTELTRRLGIDHPIIQAGMGDGAGVELAAAVSNAGGLGTIGSAGLPPRELRERIRRCRDLTDRPFAVNILTFPIAPFWQEWVEVAIEERPPIVTLSFGDPLPWLERCRAAGLQTIVQGNEAGGHTGRRGTLSFAAQAIDLAGDLPVVVAGGIADGRGLAAALALGAAGVVMGTRFKATEEFLAPAPLKSAIVASDGSNTLYDEILDLAYGWVWPNQVLGRGLRNRFTEEWTGRAEELRAAVAAQEEPFGFVGRLAADPETAINWAGESAGLIDEILPAAKVVQRTVQQAEDLLRAVAGVLRT